MALTKITANIIEDGAISTASLANTSITADKLAATLDLTGKTITVATATAGDNDTTVASTAFVSTAIANLADSAPATLDTLNELAAALGDDANFSTTVTNSIATKLPLAGGALTGNLAINTASPELFFGTIGNHYNWRVAAQENINAGFEIGVGSQDTNYADDTYVPKLVVLSSGHVGIGTESPDKLLEVSGTDVIAKFTGTDANPPQIEFEDSTGVQATIGLNTAHDFIIDTAGENVYIGRDAATLGTSILTVLSTGNVGIGTPSPAYKLEVESSSDADLIQIQSTAGANNTVLRLGISGDVATINASGGSSGALAFKTYGTERLRIDSSGNVGIGTDSQSSFTGAASQNLVVGSGSSNAGMTVYSGTTSVGGLAFADGTSLGSHYRGLVQYRHGEDAMLFYTGEAERMRISQYGALHIDNASDYTGKSWLNEAVVGSTPVGGSNASVNTYQKLRLWVDGDINLNQGRGLHFGDVTDAAPLCIREGSPSEYGTDRDRLEILGRKQITIGSSYGGISPGDSSSAGTVRSSGFYIKKTGQMGGTWTEVITTPNGGDQTTRIFEDWTGRWIMVGRFAADARTSIQGIWSSVSGLSTATSQSTATAFSADWGDAYPSEVRIMGCTDVEEYMDTRTIDFVYGNKPSGVHSYTPRQWKHFFAGGTSDGMTANAGGSPRFGFSVGYAYDGKGRWYNPNMHGMGMSDGNTTNPIAAYTTATSNAFNWNTALDAKLLATHYRTFASQDSYQTTGFGADDSVQGFYDTYPTEYTNMGGGTNGGGVHTTLSSAVFILLKLQW